MFDLWSYIAADNPAAADRVVERLNRAFDLIALNPKSGRARPDMGAGIRSFVVEKFVVFYCIEADGIDIGRIIHGSRNITPEVIWLGCEPIADK